MARQYPEFPVRRGALDWEEYLPPLSPGLRQIVEAHSGAVAGMTFLDRILDGIAKRGERIVIQEVRDGQAADGDAALSFCGWSRRRGCFSRRAG